MILHHKELARQINIILDGLEGEETIEVYDVNNKLILMRENKNSVFYNLDLSGCQHGLFTILIRSARVTNSLRVIKML